jgi:hypothetical protein
MNKIELATLRAKEFDILVPTGPNAHLRQRHIGLLAITDTDPVLIPLTYEAAKEMSDLIAKVLMLEAPELYFGPAIAKKLKAGKLTLEQVKELI